MTPPARRLHLINADRADSATLAACAAVTGLPAADASHAPTIDTVCLIGGSAAESRARLLGLHTPHRLHAPRSRSALAARGLARFLSAHSEPDPGPNSEPHQIIAWGAAEHHLARRATNAEGPPVTIIGLEPPRAGTPRITDAHLVLCDPRDEPVWPASAATSLAVFDPDARGPDWRSCPERTALRAKLGLRPDLPLVVSIGEPQQQIDARRVAWATLVLQNIGMAVTMAVPRHAMHTRGAIDLAKRTVRWSPMVIVDEPLAILRIADVGICSLPEPKPGEFGRLRATLACANRFGVPVICAGWARGMGVDESLLLPTDRPRDYGTRLADLVADWSPTPAEADTPEPEIPDLLAAPLRAAINAAAPRHGEPSTTAAETTP